MQLKADLDIQADGFESACGWKFESSRVLDRGALDRHVIEKTFRLLRKVHQTGMNTLDCLQTKELMHHNVLNIARVVDFMLPVPLEIFTGM